VGVTEARDQLGRLISRVEYRGERVVLTRNGRAVAALVLVDLLRDVEAAEDAADLAAARKAAVETGSVSHAEVLADLVADEAARRSA
jgi:prevent-host-death family protein